MAKNDIFHGWISTSFNKKKWRETKRFFKHLLKTKLKLKRAVLQLIKDHTSRKTNPLKQLCSSIYTSVLEAPGLTQDTLERLHDGGCVVCC